MPWTAADAASHTKAADTDARRELWAKVANAALERGDSEASAIRQANAAVNKSRNKASYMERNRRSRII
jgi:hypothetical protein